MVVCKYFLQGSCRFGQKCRFEHVYGSQYSYHANPSPQQQQAPGVTELINQVQTDIQAVLNGNQWILSCYAPFKEKPIFPGMHDQSPEEVRLFIYEGRANNNLEGAVTYINKLVKETRQKYERLLQPDATITKILRSLYKGEPVASPFSSADNAASSIFRSALQSSTPKQTPISSIFNQGPQSSNPKDLFASAANQTVFTKNADFFNKPQETNAKSIFAQATQNVFQQNSQTPQNIFATANQNTPPRSVFAAANQNAMAPGSVFAAANQNATAPGSVFAAANQNATAPGSVFAAANQNATKPSSVFAAANQNATKPSSVFAAANQNATTPSTVFAAANQNATATSNIFAAANEAFGQDEKQASPFQTQNVFQRANTSPLTNTFDDTVYNRMEDLTIKQLDAFKSDSFELGLIPEIAPPRELCVNTKGLSVF